MAVCGCPPPLAPARQSSRPTRHRGGRPPAGAWGEACCSRRATSSSTRWPSASRPASWSSGRCSPAWSGSGGAPGTASARCCWPLRSSPRWLALAGRDDAFLHSLGVALEPLFFLLAYLVVFAFPEGRHRPRGAAPPRRDDALLPRRVRPVALLLTGRQRRRTARRLRPVSRQRPDDRRPPDDRRVFGSDMAWAVIALLTATVVLLAVRLATASRPRRRTLLPVYVPGARAHGPAARVPRLRGGRAPPGRRTPCRISAGP